MNTNLLTTLSLGFGLVHCYHITDLLYTAMYKGNKNGIACIDCNSIGEGNIEICIGIGIFFITLYCFLNSLGKII